MNPDQQIKVAQLLKTSSEIIRDQQATIHRLQDEVHSMKRASEINKTAQVIRDKGLTTDSVEEIAAKLAQLSEPDFDRYAKAAEIATANLYSGYLTTELNKQASGRDNTPGIQGLNALDLFVSQGG